MTEFVCIHEHVRGFPVSQTRKGWYQLWLVSPVNRSHPATHIPLPMAEEHGWVVEFRTIGALTEYISILLDVMWQDNEPRAVNDTADIDIADEILPGPTLEIPDMEV